MIELLIVVVLLVIVATIPLMVLSSSSKKIEKQNHALALKAALDRVRADSMRRDGGASVIVRSTGFEVVGTNSTLGTSRSQESSTITSITGAAGTVIPHPESQVTTLPTTVSFDRSGRLTTSWQGSPVQRLAFIVCSGTCGDGPTADRYVISVTGMGMVSISRDGSQIQTIPPPVTSAVPASDSINGAMPIIQ